MPHTMRTELVSPAASSRNPHTRRPRQFETAATRLEPAETCATFPPYPGAPRSSARAGPYTVRDKTDRAPRWTPCRSRPSPTPASCPTRAAHTPCTVDDPPRYATHWPALGRAPACTVSSSRSGDQGPRSVAGPPFASGQYWPPGHLTARTQHDGVPTYGARRKTARRRQRG